MFYLSILLLLTDICCFSSFLTKNNAFMKYLYLFWTRLVAVSLDIFLSMELLCYRVCIYSTLVVYAKVLQSDFISLYSHQQYVSLPVSPHPHPTLGISGFLKFQSLCHIIVVLFCIFSKLSNVEYLLKCLVVFWIFSFMRVCKSLWPLLLLGSAISFQVCVRSPKTSQGQRFIRKAHRPQKTLYILLNGIVQKMKTD